MNRKSIYLSIACSVAFFGASAQQITFGENSTTDGNEKVSIKLGVRTSMDGALFFDDYTPLKSGATLSEARIRSIITFGKWDAYWDVDFGSKRTTQKDIFIRYNFNDHSRLRLGYSAEAFSMSRISSQADIRFITRSTPITNLTPGRSLGLTYTYRGDKYYTESGIYTENLYNQQEAGDQGFSLAGRYLYIPINNDDITIAAGGAFRYGYIGSGIVEGTPGVFKTSKHIEGSLETNVDPTVKFLDANIPWAKQEFSYNAQALVVTPRFFSQVEYIWNHIKRERPDKQLFENQLGGLYSWTTLESWQKGNPLSSLNFSGGHVELGYLITGRGYQYDKSSSLLKTKLSGPALEVVGRYSYTSLNDIKDGDIYWQGQDRFFEAGGINDYPRTSPSIAGGILHNITLGVNYNFNTHVRALLNYSYNKLDNYRFEDKTISFVQMRVQFVF